MQPVREVQVGPQNMGEEVTGHVKRILARAAAKMVGAFYLCKIGRVIFSFRAVVLRYTTSTSDDLFFFYFPRARFGKIKT